EDGIRDRTVTGVQTCALPILHACVGLERDDGTSVKIVAATGAARVLVPRSSIAGPDVEQVELGVIGHGLPDGSSAAEFPPGAGRSEERRVGKEWRCCGRGRG